MHRERDGRGTSAEFALLARVGSSALSTEAGRCNTPPPAKSGRTIVRGGGIDTLKIASYVADDRSLRALRQPGLTARPAKGGAELVGRADGEPWPLPGVRALFYPASSLLAIEGHPSGERGTLASPDDVPGWCDELREILALQGFRLDDRVGVSRCDAAVDVTTTPSYGRAVLAGVAAIVPPRMKLDTHRSVAGIETVYYETARGRKLARWYDSGVKYGTSERLTSLRAEDQRRYDRQARRLDARTLTTRDVRDAFRTRWGALQKATKGVTVATSPVLVDKLGVAVELGELRFGKAARLLGAIELLRSGARAPERTLRRVRSELRDAGLVQLEGELEPVELDVGELVERVCDEAVW
jgi:hypothetical protein